jgi:hypothetical protein
MPFVRLLLCDHGLSSSSTPGAFSSCTDCCYNKMNARTLYTAHALDSCDPALRQWLTDVCCIHWEAPLPPWLGGLPSFSCAVDCNCMYVYACRQKNLLLPYWHCARNRMFAWVSREFSLSWFPSSSRGSSWIRCRLKGVFLEGKDDILRDNYVFVFNGNQTLGEPVFISFQLIIL